MKKLMNFLMLSCQKATFLIEKGHGRPLGYLERMQLNMHLKMCKHCTNYLKQSLLIENVLNSGRVKNVQVNNLKLSDASKMRISKVIEDNSENY